MDDKGLSEAAAAVASVEDYKEWAKAHLREALPHSALISGWGHMHAGGVGLDVMVTVDFPIEHIETIRNGAGAIDTPILRRWLATERPVVFDSERPWADAPERWLESFRRYGLRNVLAHARWDPDRSGGSYHSLYGLPAPAGRRDIERLCALMPLLHETFYRVIESLSAADRFSVCLASLSERERDIVHWLGLGKTNSEIATIQGLSENTVKHYVTDIFDKLGVSNRTQLVRRLAEHQSRYVPGYVTKVF